MKCEQTKIEFSKERPFVKRMGVVVMFFRENVGQILHLSMGFLLPTVLLMTLFFTWAQAQLLKLSQVGYITPTALDSFALFTACVHVLYMLVPSFSIALLQLYNKREERLRGITFGEVMMAIKPNFIKMACLMPFVIIIYCLMSVLFVKVPSLVFLSITLVLFLGIGVPLALLIPIYMIDKISLWKAIARCFNLGYKHWGSTFVFSLVLSLIGGGISLLFAFPWLVANYVEATFYASSSTFDIPFIYQAIIFLFAFFAIVGLILSSMFVLIGTSYQYSHIISFKQKILVVDDIDKAIDSFNVFREE
jgi:hypothetical protein